MKSINIIKLCCILLITKASIAQDYKIPVANTKRTTLVFENFQGKNLPIEGYDGNEIIISIADGTEKIPERAKGLRPIYSNGNDNTGLGLNIEKTENQIIIQYLLAPNKKREFKFKVPESLSVKIRNSQGRTSRNEPPRVSETPRVSPPSPPSKSYSPKYEKKNDSINNQMMFKYDSVKGKFQGNFSYALKKDSSLLKKYMYNKHEILFSKNQELLFKKQENKSAMLKNISIKNMKNEIEINNLYSINLSNVIGPLILSSVSGSIDVVFAELNKEKPTSISSVSGEIDVTLPPLTPVELEINTISGTLYSDFDFPVNKSAKQTSGTSLKSQLNGGGVNLKIITVSGNIYFRKKK